LSEYQYYEFQAVDRLLTSAQQDELRALSTRARITATSFVNHYEWGDFKGNLARLMEHVFDLHLYLANWGTRIFSMRLPRRLIDTAVVEACLIDDEIASMRVVGEDIVIAIACDELEFVDWDDGSGWLGALAPLRSDILNGDLRLFHLLWRSSGSGVAGPWCSPVRRVGGGRCWRRRATTSTTVSGGRPLGGSPPTPPTR
jgi:hypothetical protein